MVEKLSYKITLALTFLAGVIFANAVNSLIRGEFAIAVLSLIAVGTALLLRRFFDWDLE